MPYTSFFVSSEIVKWNIKDLKVLDRAPTYYSIGHLCIPGGDSRKPDAKYVIAYNKITKDRYLPQVLNWHRVHSYMILPVIG
jgi:nitrous-oxide reductase